MIFRTIIIIMFVAIFTGCSSNNIKNSKEYNESLIQKKYKSKSKTQLDIKLNKGYKDWSGTPYQFGGTTKSGIDCSALVQNIFSEQLNVKIPRTTLLQVKEGKKIKQENLKKGDLVFFKTGRNSRHVGIYIGKRKFINASSSKGVIVSSLDNIYWSQHYWTSRRVIPDMKYIELTFQKSYAINY